MHANSNQALIEKRHYKRVRYGRSVEARTTEGMLLSLEVMDYSLGGVCVVSKSPFAVGETIELESITALTGEQRPLGLMGEVRRIQEQYQEFVIGLQFL
jgi:hypothetical protein